MHDEKLKAVFASHDAARALSNIAGYVDFDHPDAPEGLEREQVVVSFRATDPRSDGKIKFWI